jgi:hypothetical protein
MTRAKAFLTAAACLIALSLSIAHAEPNSAEDATLPDDTYGEGGTHQTVANDKHELVGEVWRDKNGIVREQFELTAGGAQLWGFFNGDGSGQPWEWRRSLIAIRPMERPPGRFEMWIIAVDNTPIKEMSTLTKAELDAEFTQWRDQLRLWVNTARRRQQGETGCANCPH